MLKFNRLKMAGAIALTIALGGTMVACGNNGAANGGISDTSQGVAATVKVKDKDDKELTLQIGEKIVTEYVQDFRERQELTDDEAWAKWMADNALTPADVRTQVINFYEQELLLDEAAKMYDVKVEESEVQEALQSIKDQFDSDEAYQEALSATGMTEEEYVEKVLEPNTLQTKLAEAVEAAEGNNTDVDAQALAMAQSMESVLDGARRSSHILFNAEDEATANEVVAQLRDGSLSWDDAVAQYSIDDYSKSNGGDNGWNAINTFVEAYDNALVQLNADEISDPVTSDYGIHIIKCTEVYQVPEGGITSLDQLPTEIAEAMRLQVENSSSDTFTAWFSNFLNSAQLDVHDMPSGLPYDVDMSAYTASNDEATQQPENGVEGTEAPVEGDQPAEGEQQPAEGEQPADQPTEGGNASDQQPTEGAEGGEGTEGTQPADQAANEGGEGGEATPAQ